MVTVTAGFVINLNGTSATPPEERQGTTAVGIRRALAVLLKQSAPGVATAGRLGEDHFVVRGSTSAMAYLVSGGGVVLVRTADGGAYIVGMPESVVVPTLPADGVNPRIDVIYARQPDPAFDGPTTDVDFIVDVAHGAPAATPVAPTLALGSLELSRKRIAPGATNTSDGAPFTNIAPVTGLNVADLSWASVTNKPTSFPPSSHSHGAGDITSGTFASARYGTNTIPGGALQNASVSGGKLMEGSVGSVQLTTPILQDIIKGADGNHTHSISQITNLQSTLNAKLTRSNSQYNSDFGERDGRINQLSAGGFGRDPWNRNQTGSRRAAWLQDDGSVITLGHTASTRDKKQDITPVEFTEEQMRAFPVVLYKYRAEVAKQQEDPEYRAATEIGTLADDLHELGLWQFVIYEGRGADARPESVHYELLGLFAIEYAHWLTARFDGLTERVAALENAG